MTKEEFLNLNGNKKISECASSLHLYLKDWSKVGNNGLEKDLKPIMQQKLVDVFHKIDHHLNF
jgi:hypothetical protein